MENDMRAVNDNAIALAQADAQLRTEAKVALERLQALKANLTTLAAVVQQLEQNSGR